MTFVEIMRLAHVYSPCATPYGSKEKNFIGLHPISLRVLPRGLLQLLVLVRNSLLIRLIVRLCRLRICLRINNVSFSKF